MSELGKYELPPGWRWATIPDLVGDDGVFCDGDWVESEDQDPIGDVRLVQLADVGDGNYRDKSARFLTRAKAKELRCTFLEPGDVLIARMPDPLGRACTFPGDVKRSVTAVDVCIVRSGNGDFDHRWLVWFVNAPPFRAAVAGLQAGSTRKRISRKNLGTIPLPVPALDEQRRIVAEIEKQFTRLEAGVAGLRRVQANLKRYRVAVLKTACEGKLVATEAELAHQEGRTFETGAKLLASILTERRQKWTGKGKYKEPAAPDTTKLPVLPKGWAWGSLDQICMKITDGEHLSPKTTTAGVFLLSAKDVREHGVQFDDPKFVSSLDAEQFRKRCNPDLGDVLVVSRGATIGRISVVQTSETFCLMGSVILLKPDQSAPGKYLATCLREQRAKERLGILSGSTAQQAIYIRDIRTIPVPLPPFAEQQCIIAEVERRLSVVEELEATVTANLQRATRLRQTILQYAFRGGFTDTRTDLGKSES